MRAFFKLFAPKRDARTEAERARAEALAESRQKWRSARAEYDRCKQARDKRGMGEALLRVKRLATETVRLELGR